MKMDKVEYFSLYILCSVVLWYGFMRFYIWLRCINGKKNERPDHKATP